MGFVTVAQQIDNKTPKEKKVLFGVAVFIILAVLAGVYYLGAVSWRGFSDSKYLKEREAALKRADDAEKRAAEYEQAGNAHLETEKKLAAENELLKKQNEATAEILKQNDARIAGDASKFDDLVKERQKRLDDINADGDVSSQVCGLCEDAERSGFKLSAEFCRQCKGK